MSSNTVETLVTPRATRNAAATAERILQAAIKEFAEHGYMGARIDGIAKRAGANIRMLYHYFGSKEELYLHVLENVFAGIRTQEQTLHLRDLEPLDAMGRLFDFTYDHFAANPLFIRILIGENLADARHLQRSKVVQALSSPLLVAIDEVLRRGVAQGVFRARIDPLQLYVSIVALSYFHISNGPTLSWLFDADLAEPLWRAQRKEHARGMLLAYLELRAS
jgi:TetR/AcrR family transcriptional regulator